MAEPPPGERVYLWPGDSVTIVCSRTCRVRFLHQDDYDRLNGNDVHTREGVRFDGIPITFRAGGKGHYWVLPDDGVMITSCLLRDALGYTIDRSKPRKQPR